MRSTGKPLSVTICRLAIGGTLLLTFSLAIPAAEAQELEPLAEVTNVPEAVRHGAALAETNCATCHAVGLAGDSTHPEAPPFWNLSERRPVETIARMLLDGETPQHSDMPVFTITETQAHDIAAWIAWVQPVAHGKRLVEENCAVCHAIGADDESAHETAPPFRILSQRYPIDALEEGFAEGIESGHPDMPVFDADIIQLQDILAYIESVQEK